MTAIKQRSKYAQQVTLTMVKDDPKLEREHIIRSEDLYRFFDRCHQEVGNNVQEHFYVAYLNRSNKIVGWQLISIGGTTGTVADPKIILAGALLSGACSIAMCHNHPSGSIKPSHVDELLTHKIKDAANLIDIHLVDHIILGEGFYSFADEGIL